MKKNQKIKVIVIIVCCVAVDIFMHIVTDPFSTMPGDPDFSFAAGILGEEVTASLWALLAFSCVSFVYLGSRNEIPGKGVGKGVRYGMAIAILWIMAMLEGVSLFGNPLINEFVVGSSDAIPVFILGILLSMLKTKKNNGDDPGCFSLKEKIKAVSIFAGTFLAGRYMAYFTGIIRSGNQSRPLETFIWTLMMGIVIGIVFVLLENKKIKGRFMRRSVKYGYFVFGLNWAAFLLFMPFLFSGYITDVLIRIVLDTNIVMIASYLTIVPPDRLISKIKFGKAEAHNGIRQYIK